MKKLDIIIVFIALAAAAGLYFFMLGQSKEGASAIITVEQERYASYALDEDAVFTVKSEKGENTVEIKDGFIKCILASCPDKLCVNQSKINKSGQTIVCLPNKMVISIEGAEQINIDQIAK